MISCDCPTENQQFELLEDTIRIVESFEPNVVRQSSVQRYISAMIREVGLKVILCGDGADELFCGYPEFWHSGDDWIELRLNFIRDLHRTQLQRIDRMGMNETSEVRVPFLSKKLISLALSICNKSMLIGTHLSEPINKAIFRQAMQGLVPDGTRLRPKVVLSEGVGLKGNDPSSGMFSSLIPDAISATEAAEIRSSFPEWNLLSNEDALYFKIFKNFGYDKATFMRKRVCANLRHSLVA